MKPLLSLEELELLLAPSRLVPPRPQADAPGQAGPAIPPLLGKGPLLELRRRGTSKVLALLLGKT